VSATDTVNGQN
ncbi:hypothetical protein D046_4568C, partial [Vibrio parahaemolyticus V-223/04]